MQVHRPCRNTGVCPATRPGHPPSDTGSALRVDTRDFGSHRRGAGFRPDRGTRRLSAARLWPVFGQPVGFLSLYSFRSSSKARLSSMALTARASGSVVVGEFGRTDFFDVGFGEFADAVE